MNKQFLRLVTVSALLFVAVACGPKAADDEGGNGTGGDGGTQGGSDAQVYTGPVGTIQGTVWAPGNAPGQVPAGHEIPISKALVFLSVNEPPAIPQEVYCDKCSNPSGVKFVISDEKGHFALDNITPGMYWFAVQKGQFRTQHRLEVIANQAINLTAAQTVLPSENDPTNGKFIPKIALGSGNYDKMEDIFGKMGLGSVDMTGTFTSGSHTGKFDVYSNGGKIDTTAMGTLASLLSDFSKMRQYHIIFIPCASDMNTAQLKSNAQIRENIKEYVKAGGKFYVTDWSAEWEDTVFPDFIQFEGSGVDTPAGATMASQFGDGDGSPSYESMHAKASDMTLNAWLQGQMGPALVSSGGLFGGVEVGMGTYNANDFIIEGNWDKIVATPRKQIGTDNDNLPVYEEAKAFVLGDWNGETNPTHPLTVTFEPQGCGRVLYSTYHTAESTHVGLIPQERILLYLIMEIGVCKSGPVID